MFTAGSIEIPFIWILRTPPFDEPAVREELRLRINRIEGVEIAEAAITKRPAFPARLLRAESELTKFYDAMEWLLGTARSAQPGTAGVGEPEAAP
ncbi:MAG: hypothetical protein KatS3mg012_2237 [Gaiellaceae bacterium]|nr:MAG: hypothetical protein KatS3mg012_2237 [Gaiellaceae bacterium]